MMIVDFTETDHSTLSQDCHRREQSLSITESLSLER
jgi:hypothetical protein